MTVLTFTLALKSNCSLDFQRFSTNINLYLENIFVQVNIDGISVCESSNSHIWPILIYLNDMPFPPIIVAAFHGRSKPENLNFFRQNFIDEFIILRDTGFQYERKSFF